MPITARFDPFLPEIHENPYPYYATLRAEDPVHWGMPFQVSAPGAWYISRYADVSRLLKDNSFVKNLSSVYPPETLPPVPEPIRFYAEMSRHALLLADPPDHSRLRKLVSQAFTPRVISNLRAPMEGIAEGLLHQAGDGGELDLIADYAFPLTLQVIATMIGVPEEQRDLLWRWSRVLIRTLDLAPSMETYVEADRVAHEAFAYFGGLVEERRAHPADDLLSRLIAAHDQEEGRLSEEELIVMCTLLLIAGFDTTVNLIGNGTLVLLQHPEQRSLLTRRPELMSPAIEEMLRFEPSTQKALRYASSDYDIGNRRIGRGDAVILLLASANRDPEVFPDPDRFDISRGDNRHLGFGAGIHVCLGAPLARVEGQVAITTALRRFPTMRLVSDHPEWREDLGTFRRLSRLLVSTS